MVFAVLIAVAAALVLAYRYPPLVDWPEHLAQDAIVAHLRDRSYGVGRYYQASGWFLPYQGFRWLHLALARVFGMNLGGRIALLGYLAVLPLTVAALIRRFGRDPWIAIAAFAVLVDANFLWGFAPYALATTLCLAALGLAIDYGRRGGAWRLAALTASGVALFFTHPQQTAQYLVALGALVAVAWQRRAITSRRAMTMLASGVPSGLLLVAFLVRAGWLDGTVLTDAFALHPPTVWRAPRETLKLLPFSAGLTVSGRLPFRLYLATLGALTLGSVAQRWLRRNTRAPEVPAGDARPWSFAAPTLALTWLMLTMALPAEFRGQTLSPRLASAALLGLLWLPRLEPPRTRRERWIAWPVYAVATVAACSSLAATHVAFARFDRTLRPLDAVIARVPIGSRVATLVYETRGNDGLRLPVYLHIGGYLVAARGGMASAGFTRTGVSYRGSVPRESLLVNQEWLPSVSGWQLDPERYGPFYDYVLVRTGPLYRGSPFASESHRWTVTREIHQGVIELWHIEPRGSPGNGGATLPAWMQRTRLSISGSVRFTPARAGTTCHHARFDPPDPAHLCPSALTGSSRGVPSARLEARRFAWDVPPVFLRMDCWLHRRFSAVRALRLSRRMPRPAT